MEDWDRYAKLCDENIRHNQNNNINENSESIKKSIHDALDKCFKKSNPTSKGKKKPKIWWNDEIKQLHKEYRRHTKEYKRDSTQFKKSKMNQANRAYSEAIKKSKEECWQQFCSDIVHKTTSKKVWDFVNKIKGREPKTTSVFKVGNAPIVDPKEKANTFVKHYQNVSREVKGTMDAMITRYNNDKLIGQIIDSKGPALDKEYNKEFSFKELMMALNTCKNGAPGEDGIIYEFIKRLNRPAKEEILKLYNQSWREGTSPDKWTEGIVIPILKANKDKGIAASYSQSR